jgi:two-component system, OmpR family, alkaline phosphatase synthesis response regulator PhoP
MEKKKILIVDDEVDIVETLSFALEQNGYDCITAHDGIDGLNMARSESPNLVLLDVMLPKMNGYKVSRMLKFDENYQHIPIIMLTAKSQDSDRITGIETGADGYLTKPFDLKTLISMIKNHIG